MEPSTTQPYTVGSTNFHPDAFFKQPNTWAALQTNDLRSAIIQSFALPPDDSYTYHASASVTLTQVQTAVDTGAQHGLHDWYADHAHPPAADITAYIALFDPSRSAANTLKSLQANAKKGSLRAGIAEHLLRRRFLDPSITVPRRKAASASASASATPHQDRHANPYLDFWAWSCHALQYAGPDAHTATVTTSHHVLPVLMHHFGCACPSYEALDIIRQVSGGRTVLDVGCGNGYWTLMLRRIGVGVVAVDSGQSAYRTCWIGDVVAEDGVEFLRKRRTPKDDVLLLVYPITAGGFTERVLRAFRGDVVCVVGTQNRNGYTGFRDVVVDDWMEANREGFQMLARVPVPSFAGKDDALFVFVKKKKEKDSEIRR